MLIPYQCKHYPADQSETNKKNIMGGAHPTSQKNLRLTCLSIATSKRKPLISTQQELKDNM